MADKSNFTPDEWKLLLESVMMAGMAVTAADPSGLWGLLKESMASGSELVSAKTNAAANPLIKAIVADFETGQGRSTVRDGLSEQLKRKKPAEVTAKCIETLRRAAVPPPSGSCTPRLAKRWRRPCQWFTRRPAGPSREVVRVWPANGAGWKRARPPGEGARTPARRHPTAAEATYPSASRADVNALARWRRLYPS